MGDQDQSTHISRDSRKLIQTNSGNDLGFLINRQCWRALLWQNADWGALTFLKRILDVDQEPKAGFI